MTKPFSMAFKQQMVERMTGADAISATKLADETGITQQTLSNWLSEARTLPLMPLRLKPKKRSIEEKVRILGGASGLSGAQLARFLSAESVPLAEFEQWRLALGDDSKPDMTAAKRIRRLERELTRKESALAEAAALLVLKKKVEHLWEDEDDDTDEPKEK